MKLEPRLKVKRGERAVAVVRQEEESTVAFDPYREVPEGTWELVEQIARDLDTDRVEATGFRLARLAVVDQRVVDTIREAGQLEKLLKLVRFSFERLEEGAVPTGDLRDVADMLVFGPEVRRVAEPFLPELFDRVRTATVRDVQNAFSFIHDVRSARTLLQLYPERQAELREEYRRVIRPEQLIQELSKFRKTESVGTALTVGAEFRLLFPDLGERIEEALKPFWSLLRELLARVEPKDIFNLHYDVLRDAAILAAGEAYIDEQGNLQLEKRQNKVSIRSQLPDRPQV